MAIDVRGGAQVITAEVSLAEMFGYVGAVRSITQGRSTYTMQFSHYDRVPESVSKAIVAS
jgi:elongation factor G